MGMIHTRPKHRHDCPKCGSPLVTAMKKLVCSQSGCDYVKPSKRQREKFQAKPTCVCGSEMSLRAIRGHKAFWGCSRYPACAETQPIHWQWRNRL